jgi:hypothetical protein
MHIDVDLPTAHDDGHFISGKVSRIVELVREYDSRLDVKWIPPNMRSATDPAFAITERLSDGRDVVAFYVQDESEMDERVLERVLLGDNTKHDKRALRHRTLRLEQLLSQSEGKKLLSTLSSQNPLSLQGFTLIDTTDVNFLSKE